MLSIFLALAILPFAIALVAYGILTAPQADADANFNPLPCGVPPD